MNYQKCVKFRYTVCIGLLIIFLMGCGSVQNKVIALPEPLEELKTEVEALYENLWKKDLLWYDRTDKTTWADGARYYGTVDGAEVFYIPRHGGVEVELDSGVYLYLNGGCCTTKVT